MRRFSIKFSQTEEGARFVRILNRYDVEASVKCGSRTVDAKSIMGVLALAKSKTAPLILQTEAECPELMEELAPFAA